MKIYCLDCSEEINESRIKKHKKCYKHALIGILWKQKKIKPRNPKK